ncbi:3525_t:CDS:1, partial [Gigaspora margarita]
AAPKFQPYLNFSTFKPANRSLSSLKESVIQIILIANRTKVFDVITSISPQENNVVIIMLDEDKIKNRKFMNAITPYGPKIEIIQKNKAISSQPEIDMSEDGPKDTEYAFMRRWFIQ